MKQTLIHLSVFLSSFFVLNSLKANTYYFSSASGSDSRTPAQAQNSATPWQSLNKLNSYFNSLQPGDMILFKSGETFYGNIVVTKSGTTSQPITFSSYGTGNKPVITGFTTLSSWVSIGNGIYESYNSSLASVVNMLTLDGSMQSMGRYPNIDAPNKGYLAFESHNSNSITDNQLTSAINWTGAELVVRTKRWVLDRVKITSHSGHTLSYNPALTYTPYDDYGYFIQNHIKTLDQLGEWYYNPSTKKMAVYFGSNNPSSYNVQASAISTLVSIDHHDNIIFNGVAFNGSNAKTFDFFYANDITVQSCNITFSGVDAIDASATDDLVVQNTYFNFTNNNTLDLNYNCNNSSIRYNYIANTGMLAGMGLSGNITYIGISIFGANNLVEFNTIYNTGFSAIHFSAGNSNVIKNNFINYFTTVKSDGGGVYSVEASGSNYTGQKITGNIVLNGIGASEGTDQLNFASSNGIFLDDNCSNIDITSNTVSACGRSGILVHNSFKINILNNVLYDNTTQLSLIHDYAMPNALLRNMVVKNNVGFARTDSQDVVYVRTEANDISLLGVMDSNYFSRPVDDDLTMTSSCVIGGIRVDRYQDLANWQSTYNLDKASQKAYALIPSYNINSFSGSNKFTNGSFNSSISGLYTSPSSSWISSKLDGGTFQATNQFSTINYYYVVIGIGAVSSSKSYVLNFSSLASKDTLSSVYLRFSGPPYTRISDIKMNPLSTSRRENQYVFTAPASAADASIIFEIRCPKLNFWLDNIELYDASVTQTDPDDYIVFEYNNSARSKTVPLSGTYTDAYGKTYSGSVVIPPFYSVVLVKQTTANLLYSFKNSNKSPENGYLVSGF